MLVGEVARLTVPGQQRVHVVPTRPSRHRTLLGRRAGHNRSSLFLHMPLFSGKAVAPRDFGAAIILFGDNVDDAADRIRSVDCRRAIL